MWNEFQGMLKGLGKIDLCVVNGDAIDGPGKRSGGVEQLTTDMNAQAEMAADALKTIPAKEFRLTYGTPYHTGYDRDDEDQILFHMIRPTKIGAEQNLKIEGWVFNFRHFVSGSQLPHGRATAVKRERLQNLLWAEKGHLPKADVIVRSHVHYFEYSGTDKYLSVVTPALQAPGTKYGARMCSGPVDFGIVWFDVEKDSFPVLNWNTRNLKKAKGQLEVL